MRGPLVFCFEELDNGPGLDEIAVSSDFTALWDETLADGVPVLYGSGRRVVREDWGDILYRNEPPDYVPVKIKAVPYFVWGNRGDGEMSVWMRE
jgi:DUF1680 family protein